MPSNKELFFSNLALPATTPLGIEITHAKGMYMYTPEGHKILDLLAGISVSNLGHQHPDIVQAVKDQAERHMHLMVYGEVIQGPQVKLAEKICELLGPPFSSVYFGNSGAEATEGALKLARKATGRTELISFKNAYHGSTHGALSVMGDETLKQPFRPLLPDVRQIRFNVESDLQFITTRTAGVIVEPVQGEAGYIPPADDFLQKLSDRCKAVGALLIFDEIQTGFGRTGPLFAFHKYSVLPDIITLAKGLGGGMPIGAFAAKKSVMDHLSDRPILGHITTFGGHPVSAAAALKNCELIQNGIQEFDVVSKEKLFKEKLVHPRIKEITGTGLMLAVHLETFDEVQYCMDRCLEKGLLIDWFLFNSTSLRISPPLIISRTEIEWACSILLETLDEYEK